MSLTRNGLGLPSKCVETHASANNHGICDDLSAKLPVMTLDLGATVRFGMQYMATTDGHT